MASVQMLTSVLKRSVTDVFGAAKAADNTGVQQKRSEARQCMAKAKANAARPKAASAAGAAPDLEFAIFRMNWSEPHIKVIEAAPEKPKEVDWNVPYQVQPSTSVASLANKPPCQLNLMVFKTNFRKDSMTNPALRRTNELTGAALRAKQAGGLHRSMARGCIFRFASLAASLDCSRLIAFLVPLD